MAQNPEELQQQNEALQQQVKRQAQIIDELRYVMRWGAEKLEFSRDNPEYRLLRTGEVDMYIRTTSALVSQRLGKVAAHYYPDFTEQSSSPTEDPNSYPSNLPPGKPHEQTEG